MEVNLSAALETLTPSQYITFTIPSPIKHRHLSSFHTPLLHVAVLDSPTLSDTLPPLIAAMIVPNHRETDWNFCTKSGHLQLLSSNVSRLILIGNHFDNNISYYNNDKNEYCVYIRPPVIDALDKEKLESELKDLVIALHPKLCFQNGVPKNVLFLSYEDDVLCSVIVGRFVGRFVGEFVVEDVQVEVKDGTEKEFRRRLRFKRMPNLIQSQVRLVCGKGDVAGDIGRLDLGRLREMKEVEFRVDTGILVHAYLNPMVCGLFLIVVPLNERIERGLTPRALCLGVGGGALLSFLNAQLGFEVVGVEADEVVLSVARKYFGLKDGQFIRIIVGDAIKLIENVGSLGTSEDILNGKFDVVMVDLDSSKAVYGLSAPPPEFVKKCVLQAMRRVLHDHGVLVINVIPRDKLFYETLIQELRDVFHKVYEIDVDNDGSFVLMATLSPITSIDNDNAFLKRLRSVISGSYMDSIVEL
uniref:eEF1A lysine and N-terminal methyltransferase n=1 Tax=Erigeron canadensis TaxID=72917 RepID=UPI001CB96023|nr:eEF1A lysine and N-terminal methyltransferase [Erigeron canadensis]